MVRLDVRAFDRVVHEVIDDLPDEFRRVLDRVPVIVDRWPSPALLDLAEEDDDLLGLFVGPDIGDWNATDAPPETARIYLFQGPLEGACETRGELKRQIRVTLLHEIGHCLGFDEDGLQRIGLG